MNKCLLSILIFLLFSSCTVYTEKQSEALSRSVFATKDSIDNARVDLANKYADETVRIVKPPKKRIYIRPIYKKNIDVVSSSNKKTPTALNKQRILIIPEQYKNDTVVVVNSEEYQQLLKDKETFAQIEKDNKNLIDAKRAIDEELSRQIEYSNKMIKDLNLMQKKLVEKDLAILQRNIIIIGLLATIVGAAYLRIKGIL